ncbi:MAG: ABC transporter permease [Planctomycetota bacterium]|nr:ABC transporter permease [Planctomycetota bacterium]
MTTPVSIAASLLPGLGHVRRGFLASGVRFLVFSAAWLLIVGGRWRAIATLFDDLGFEAFVALGFLVVFPVLLVWIAHRSLNTLVNPPPREGMGSWQLAWRELRNNPRGVWGMTLLGLLYMAVPLAPVLAPYDPNEPGAGGTVVHKFQPPMSSVMIVGHIHEGEIACKGMRIDGDTVFLDRVQEHAHRDDIQLKHLGPPKRGWSREAHKVRTMVIDGHEVPYRKERHLLGTDSNGRDLLARLVYGSRISLSIGFAAMFVAVTLGVIFGSLAGYFGSWVDMVIMRLVDILLAFPRLLLLLLIVSVNEGAGIFTVVVILGATGWMGVSRLVRAQFLQVKELDYAVAAKSLGFSRPRIMFRHLLPNCMAPVIVNATLVVGSTILVEAALSFLGFGVQPPDASWGNIISDGKAWLENAWWISTIPGLLIVFAVVCFNLAGDALRDALDPRGRQ